MRIQAHHSDASRLHLERALLIYSDGEKAACTLHQIAGDPSDTKKPVILAGRPAERKDIIDLAKQLSGVKQSEKRHLLPANLLVASVDLLAWHLPSAKRRIFFETSDKTFNADVNGREVLHPALLFVAKESNMGRSLYVFALQSNQRPDESSQVFVAPYYNLYGNSHMCTGDYKLPETLDPSTIPSFESAFFDTHFSHTNTDARKLTAHPHGHHALWREMLKTRRKSFPTEYLKPALDATDKPLTLGKVIE